MNQKQYNFFIKTDNNADAVLLYLCTSWCSPCQLADNLLKKFEISVKSEKLDIDIFKLNLEENKDIVKHFQIKNIPCFLFFYKDKLIKKYEGLHNLQLFFKEIKEFLLKKNEREQ